MVPMKVRVLGPVRGWSAGRPSGGRLGESLSHPSSMEGLDEQRQSIVLELYCRKPERKREGSKGAGGPGRAGGGPGPGRGSCGPEGIGGGYGKGGPGRGACSHLAGKGKAGRG